MLFELSVWHDIGRRKISEMKGKFVWPSWFCDIIFDIYNIKFHAISSIVESSCRFDSKFTVRVPALPCRPAETNERSVLVKKRW